MDYATVHGRRHDNWHLYGDAARCTANPLIPENHGEFPITNGVGYAINGNRYTTSLGGLPADTLVDVGKSIDRELSKTSKTTGATARRPRRGGKSAEASGEMLLFGFECDV